MGAQSPWGELITRTLERAADKLNPSRAQTRTKSVTPMHANSHARHTHRAMHTRGHDVPTHTTALSSTRSVSNTSSLAVSHSTHTGALGPSPQNLGLSITPPRTRTRGPQSLLSPWCSPRHPKAPPDSSVAETPGTHLGPGCPPPRRAPSHLATAAATREAHGSRRLHWRRSPRSRGCGRLVLRGGTPVGAGPRSARQPLQPLAS